MKNIIIAVCLLCSFATGQSVPASGANDPRGPQVLRIYDWTAPLNWPMDATKWLRGDRNWSTLPAAPVSSVFGRTGAVVAVSGDYSDALISFTDVITNNASFTKHGFLSKLPNDATVFLNGVGAFTTPAGAGPETQIKVSITSAQLKNLRAAPVTLVAAPGVNKILHIVGLFFRYKFGTIAYTNAGGGNMLVQINPAAGDWSMTAAATGFLTAGSSQIESFTQTSTFFGPLADGTNQALQLTLSGAADLTLGDGTLDITILYAVIDAS